MTYSVKEVFYTLQGEGSHAGRPAVFCRFAGCNLWSGREEDRKDAVCRFCDTDFVGTNGADGGKFSTAEELADLISSKWPRDSGAEAERYVVCTGGEPLLQLDAALINALHQRSFEVGVETNGTLAPPSGVDWICVSPKSTAKLVVTSGDELKFVYPQSDINPEDFVSLKFKYFFIQPMDGEDQKKNTQRAIEYCKAHPNWRLSLQIHKVLGIP